MSARLFTAVVIAGALLIGAAPATEAKEVSPKGELEIAFEKKIQAAKTQEQKCEGISSVVVRYMERGYSGAQIYKAYEFVDRKYPGLIDACDR